MKKGSLKELMDSIIYCIESKKGLYSLDTYLDILSEYADKQILSAEREEELCYMGGKCEISLNESEPYINMSVTLYFVDNENNNVVKEASRKLPLSRFTSETPAQIGGGLTYEIDKPEV